MSIVEQAAYPITKYQSLSPEELRARIIEAKKTLGDQVLVLGHNYQRDEVIEHADFRGDSLLLAKESAARLERPNVVFCGVHFMAETADILSQSNQTVILPDMAAGCSMADMAAIEQVDQCWETLARYIPVEEAVTPLVYVNSAAILKAFCGEHGGATCTSSNARAMMEWAWSRREKILFFPDEHLGRNTANAMKFPREEMIVWDPFQPNGGNSAEEDPKRPTHFVEGPLQCSPNVSTGTCRLLQKKIPGYQHYCSSGMS